MSILRLENVSYCYDPLKEIRVLNDISYEFEKGKIYAIVGKSGSGKTTLLSLLSGLATPTDGAIYFKDKNVAEINQSKYRSQMVGVIFQSYNLLLHYNAVENVMLSLDISKKHFESKKAKALEALAKVNLSGDKIYRKILKLSGGEQQRVAIARSLAFDPEVILADEPTGNLDIGNQNEIMDIFKKLVYEHNKCIIVVTHSPEVASCADVVYQLAEYVAAKKPFKAIR